MGPRAEADRPGNTFGKDWGHIMKRKRQWFALLLALCLLASLAVLPASAEDPKPEGPEQGEIEPGKQDPDKQDPDKQDPDKQDPDKQDPDKQDPDKQDPDKQDPDKQDPDKQDPDKQDPDKQDPDKQDPDKQDPDKQDPDKQDPDKQDPDKQDPDKQDPDKQGPNKPSEPPDDKKPEVPQQPQQPVNPPAASTAPDRPASGHVSYDSSVDFGTLEKGDTGNKLKETVTIRNTSDYAIRFSASTATNGGFTLSGLPATVEAGKSCTVTITLNSAKSTGDFSGRLRFTAAFTEGAGRETEFTLNAYATVAEKGLSITVTPASKDFGKLKEGYEEKTAREKEITVTVKNNGASSVRMNGVKDNSHFTVTAVKSESATVNSGKEVDYKIVPKQDLKVGTYIDTIVFQTREGAAASFKATVVIEKALDPLTVEPAAVDFGAVEEGYAQPTPKTITVKNNTDGAIRLEQPSAYSYELSQLSATSLAAGASATFILQPRAGMPAGGYNSDITVRSTGGETAKLSVRFTVNRKAGPSSFSDVAAGSTFAADIAYVSQQGLMSGKGGGLFKPQDAITRGQLVTILYRLEGQPAVSGAGFSDVAAGSYCEKAVKWAAANSITNGGKDGTFKPNASITREQLAAFLYRYNQYKGYPTDKRADLSAFTDGASAASYAKDALSWANGAGLVNGTSDGRLNPSGGATRGQAAAILHRFCVSIGK